MRYQRSTAMERRLAANRAKILRSARKLIARGGFRAAQMNALAASTELSIGALYRYFPSKAHLFIEVLTTAVRNEIELLEAVVDAPGTAAERLQRAVELFARRALDGPRLAYAFIAEPVDPEIDRARIRARRKFSAVFQRLLRQGIRAGEFRAQDVETAAACIVGSFTEALVGPIAPNAKDIDVRDRARLISTIGRFCVDAVKR